MKKPDPLLEKYEQELGADARARQEARTDNCFYCWAAPGALHAALCPNRPEDEEAAPPAQEEGLF